jgi:ketosteroid isomerase-like protein
MTPSRRASLSLFAALAFVGTSVVRAQGVEAPRVPLRTALHEINTLRAEYADGVNKKATATLTGMYLSDAIVIRPDGSTLVGREAIGAWLAEQASGWGTTTLSSDTVRVFGNTAWDVGTMSSQGSDGAVSTSRYLVVLRRGVQQWQIASVAVVAADRVTATK